MRHLRLVRATDPRQEAAIAARAVEEQARPMLVAIVVMPEGPRVVWCEGDRWERAVG